MKICILSPNIHSSVKRFPERIFAPRTFATYLVNGLKKRGHTVYFASAPDIETESQMIGGDRDLLYQPHLKIDRYLTRLCLTETEEFTTSWTCRQYYELDLIERTISMAGKAGFEIIHTDYPLVHFFEEFSKVPIVYTLHDRLPHENTLDYWILSKFRQHKFIAISQSQKKGLLPLNFVGTVFHGINLEDYPFSLEVSGNYMAFIGRLIRDKGAHNAVKVADELKFDLHIATEPVYKKNIYFKKEIEPYVDGERVNVLGYITGREKMEFYQNARLLLFPIEWEEPFGLVMIEAMACGTPVVAFARGSVQEVIKDGVTGFVIEAENGKNGKGRTLKGSVPKTQIKKRGVEGLIEAVEKIYSMPEDEYKKMRLACRKHVEENFTTEKMAEGYETIYRKVLSHK